MKPTEKGLSCGEAFDMTPKLTLTISKAVIPGKTIMTELRNIVLPQLTNIQKPVGEIPLVQSIRESGDEGAPITLDESSPVAEAFMQMARNIDNVIKERKL